MQDDGHNPPEREPASEPEPALAVDHQGIPILNEVVEPDELESAGITDLDQNSLPLFDSAPNPAANPEPVATNDTLQALRGELLGVIDQTAAAVAERFRENLQQTLREELTRALDERLLQSINKGRGDDPE